MFVLYSDVVECILVKVFVINELLHAGLAQERLAELVVEMSAEAGPSSREAYERVLAQWLAD